MKRVKVLRERRKSHIIGDVISIDDERWVVNSIDVNSKNWADFHLIPLFDFIAGSTYCSQIPEALSGLTLMDYINMLCDEYIADCAG